MKHRRVYSTPNVSSARSAVEAARQAGIGQECIALVARSDIELDSIPDRHKEADTDFMPAAIRGAAWGGGAGLLAGLVAVVATPLGLTLAGAAITGLVGAMIGTWASALAGSTLPDPVRQKFDDEIKAGRILLVIDGEENALQAADQALRATGAEPLPFDATTAAIR
ncbi:MAG TPA: hypothetical protein VEY50_01560 [Lysobacter sp.]|nr:hypothetical protein [Lysobacter sp.]